jgi:hypothetical protein
VNRYAVCVTSTSSRGKWQLPIFPKKQHGCRYTWPKLRACIPITNVSINPPLAELNHNSHIIPSGHRHSESLRHIGPFQYQGENNRVACMVYISPSGYSTKINFWLFIYFIGKQKVTLDVIMFVLSLYRLLCLAMTKGWLATKQNKRYDTSYIHPTGKLP